MPAINQQDNNYRLSLANLALLYCCKRMGQILYMVLAMIIIKAKAYCAAIIAYTAVNRKNRKHIKWYRSYITTVCMYFTALVLLFIIL